MKKIVLLFAITVLFISSAFSQQQKLIKQDANKYPTMKPVLIVSDIYMVMQILDGIDIKGKEVEAFLDIKNHLKSYLDEAKKNKLKVTDNITVEMPTFIAHNIIFFLNRATLRGNMADQYKRFVDALVKAAPKPKKK